MSPFVTMERLTLTLNHIDFIKHVQQFLILPSVTREHQPKVYLNYSTCCCVLLFTWSMYRLL